MKQLYATGTLAPAAAPTGTDTPSPGRTLRLPSVKAATGGVEAAHLHAVLPAALYAAPAERSTDSARPLPVRLALLATPTGRVLTHAAPGGDGYVSHTLLNVPDTVDAALAIQAWGSPQWQTCPPESTADLPELPYLPVADVLDDADLKDWLDSTYHRELLEFALTVLLGTPKAQRVFLAAPAGDVARTVYGVTRALPADLLADFTFSTYEADPLAGSARLVGYDGDADLPDACYRGAGAALNTGTGKRTDLAAAVPFAGFAVERMATGDFAPLDELKAAWQRLGLTDARQFDLIVRLTCGGAPLTKDEAADALKHPPLAGWLAARPDTLGQLLEWALADRGFAHAAFGRAVQSLRQKPDVTAKLSATVREAGLAALTAGDQTRTANALEVVLPMVAPAKANAVWGDLLTRVADPAALPWDMRWYLLPRFVRFKQQQGSTGVDPAFAKWLDAPADRLGELLALDLPRAYQLAAGRVALARDGEPTAELARTLAAHPPLALDLLRPADGRDETSVKLFEALLREAAGRSWFEDAIARAADYPPPLLDRFLDAALAAGTLDAARLVRTHGDTLLTLFAGRPGLDHLARAFLAAPPADVLHDAATLAFLGKLQDESTLTDEPKARIDAVRGVRAFLDAPRFTQEALAPVAAAFAHTPAVLPPAAKGEVFDAVATELRERLNADTLQADLEAALAHLGGTLATDPTDLYENVLRDLRVRAPEFGKSPRATHAFLAVALGSTHSPELHGTLDGLDGHAFAVASDAARLGGNRLLDALDDKANGWPKEARTKWGFLLAAVRPRSRWRRDLAFLAVGTGVGAALASAAWVAARFVM